MNKLGKSAIHDHDFKLFMVIKIAIDINRLIREINSINHCVDVLTEWKSEEFYTSKTTYSTSGDIKGLELREELTLAQWKKILSLKQNEYNKLIGFCEESLLSLIHI